MPAGVLRGEAEVQRPTLPTGAGIEEVTRLHLKNMRINTQILEKVGYTPGCRKCRLLEAGDLSQGGLAHSAACRTRVEGLVKNNDELRHHVGKVEERRNTYLAREIGARIAPPSERGHSGAASSSQENMAARPVTSTSLPSEGLVEQCANDVELPVRRPRWLQKT